MSYQPCTGSQNFQKPIPTYTLAEYEAAKNNIPEGSLFNISDDKTQVTNVTNNKYSTDEIIVGEWIDGKPLYRKTYMFNLTIPQDSTERTTTYDANISALNIDFFGSEVLSIEGLNVNNILRPNVEFLIGRDGIIRYWQNASSNTNYKIAFSIVYTKTTD